MRRRGEPRIGDFLKRSPLRMRDTWWSHSCRRLQLVVRISRTTSRRLVQTSGGLPQYGQGSHTSRKHNKEICGCHSERQRDGTATPLELFSRNCRAQPLFAPASRPQEQVDGRGKRKQYRRYQHDLRLCGGVQCRNGGGIRQDQHRRDKRDRYPEREVHRRSNHGHATKRTSQRRWRARLLPSPSAVITSHSVQSPCFVCEPRYARAPITRRLQPHDNITLNAPRSSFPGARRRHQFSRVPIEGPVCVFCKKRRCARP